MQSYVTSTETERYYSTFGQYDATDQSEALATSFGLVNSYIAPEVKIPAVTEWDGQAQAVNAPAVLKLAQARFIQYLLEFQNVGYTTEGQELFDSIVAILRGIVDGDLSIPGTEQTNVQTGWSQPYVSCSRGFITINNPGSYSPAYPVTYQIEIDSDSTSLNPYGDYNTTDYATFKWREYGDADWREEEVKADRRWSYIGNHGLTIAFTGIFAMGDTWNLLATPAQQATAVRPSQPGIEGHTLSY